MSNKVNESGINVSAGCNINKAVDIINKADDVNIDLEQYTELHDDEVPTISPEQLISAAIDIKNSVVNANNNSNDPDSNNITIPDNADSNINSSDCNNNINNPAVNNNIPKNNTTVNDNELVKYGNRYVTREELLEYSSKGGKTAGARSQGRKTAKDILQKLLQAQLKKDSIDEILGESADILGEDKTVYAVMCTKMIQIACAGDIKAFIAIRDTVGDKPADEHLLTADIMTDGDRRMIENLKRRMDKQAMSLHNTDEK